MVPDLTQPDAELEKFIYKKVESLVALKEYFKFFLAITGIV